MRLLMRMTDYKGERELLGETMPDDKIGTETIAEDPTEEIVLTMFKELKERLEELK